MAADYTQDAGFMAAPKSEQFAYLSHVDPDFAKASAEDQAAYVNHITKASGAPESTSADTIKKYGGGEPTTPPWERTLSGAWSGLKAMNPYKGVSSPGEFAEREAQVVASPFIPLVGMGKQALATYERERQAGQGIIPSVGSSIGSVGGLDTEGIKQRAQQGDVAGVIGEGIPAVIGTVLGAEADRVPLPSMEDIKTVGTSPVRYAARTAEAAANAKLSPLKATKGLMQPADEAVNMKIKIPGRDFGLPEPKPAPQMPVMSSEPFTLQSEAGPTIGENATQLPIEFPTMAKPQAESVPRGTIPSMSDLQRGIEDAAGVQRNVPFREQLSFRIGEDGNVWAKTPGSNFEVSIPKGMTDPSEINSYAREKIGLQNQFQTARMPQVGRGPLGNRVNLDVRENSGVRMEAPEKMPEIIPEEVGRSMGAEPLKPNVPFREQGKPTAEPVQSEKARIEAKYPDSALRQMVHANGEAMVDRVGDNPDLLRAVHDLKNPDVRQAAINGGMKMVREDGSPIMVNNRKASGDIPRQKVFEELLKRGHSPEQIIEMAKPPAEAKPGPIKAGRETLRATGD